MGILDLMQCKPNFLRQLWEIPAPKGEPNCFAHRVSFVLPLRLRWDAENRIEFAFGQALSSRRALQGCLGEVIERYGGYKRDLRKIRIVSWDAFKEEALHPAEIASYSESQFRGRKFPYSRFTEETRVGWVRGFSFIRQVPVWVPTQMVFLAPYLKDEVHIMPTLSTGLACGASRDEAVLHGLYEVIERDALAITWLNKLSMPLVNLREKGTTFHPLRLRIEKKLARPHLKFWLIQMTTDLGIPAYCAISEQADGNWPRLVIGCSSGLNAEKAVESALVEAVAGRVVHLYHEKKSKEFTRGKSEVQVFRKVNSPMDHGNVYVDPRFSKYADFLWASKSRVSMNALPNDSTGNAKRDLATCLAILKEKGYDVIVVDITPKEVAKYGLTVVRVIIPGIQPLHFGWHAEFLLNRRLFEAPKLLGYTDRMRTEKDIYRIPHPMM